MKDPRTLPPVKVSQRFSAVKSVLRVPFLCILAFCFAGAEAAPAQTVNVWLTTHDQVSKLQPRTPVVFTNGGGGTNPLIVDETQTYQQVEGFGASFTDSAAYLLNQVATPAARSNAMNSLFTRNGGGIGVSFVRNPMGAADLSRSVYSYDDLATNKTDVNLTNFSIAHDQANIIPLLQQALNLNPDLKIMATPWSPPGWMKTSGSMITGSLLPTMYAPYARYFVRYIQAFQAAGIPTHYISLQNEPLYEPPDYPGMLMNAATQIVVLRDHVLPTLAASNITTKVLVYDQNWYESGYPTTVLSDPTLRASSQVAGPAWHGYGGTPGVMLTLANQFPTKGNYQVEHSSGTFIADPLRADFTEIIHVMRCYGRAYVKWSLALNQNHGPNTGGCSTCNPLVIINSSSGALSYSIDFYTLGHFSKFVLPGAFRVYSANASGVVSAAFVNPDGSKALVAFNDTTSSKTFQVQWGSQSFNYTLASYAGATFTWTGTQTGAYKVNPANQIQGSSFSTVSGIQTEWTSDPVGGYNLGYCDNGDYAVYKNVDFAAGFTNVTARVASFAGGSVEFHLDSPTGLRIGSVTMPNTGDFQTFTNVSGSITSGRGLHNLYLVFKGASGVGNLNSFQFDGALPAAPTGLAATPGNAQVTLNWTASSGTTSYKVKRATVSGGPYGNLVTGLTLTTYTNTGLGGGTTNYYVVSAVNAAGESPNSGEVAGVALAANTAPVLTAISNRTVVAGNTLVVSNSASDTDVPTQALTYGLLSPPGGASINPSSGMFTWRPAIAPSPFTQAVNVVVSDSGVPVLSTTQSFVVTVKRPVRPSVTGMRLVDGQWTVTIAGDAGPDYTIQVSTNLTSWNPVFTTNSPVLPFDWTDTNGGTMPYSFFRVLLGP